MPRIAYELKAYKPANPWGLSDGSGDIEVTIPELLHAAITVGHPDYSTALGGGSFYALCEAIWKASSCLMALQSVEESRWTPHRRYAPTQRFLDLDPSEKRGATYQLGLTITKVFARRMLGVNWLMHIDRYGSKHVLKVAPGRSRPDLFGVDAAGEWYVFESKGRVSPPNDEAKIKAKGQAARVVSISGKVPALNASIFAFIGKHSGHCPHALKIYSEDPPPGDNPDDQEKPRYYEPIVIEQSAEEVIQSYYAPFVSLFDANDLRLGSENLERKLSDIDLTLRLDSKIYKLYTTQNYEGIRALYSGQRVDSIKRPNDRTLITDGIEIVAGPSWIDRFQKKR